MPHFYIDTSDQDRISRDEIGHAFADIEAAREAAVAALPDMARDILPDGDERTFLAIVRDEANQPLLHAALSLSVVWLVEGHRKPA